MVTPTKSFRTGEKKLIDCGCKTRWLNLRLLQSSPHSSLISVQSVGWSYEVSRRWRVILWTTTSQNAMSVPHVSSVTLLWASPVKRVLSAQQTFNIIVQTYRMMKICVLKYLGSTFFEMFNEGRAEILTKYC